MSTTRAPEPGHRRVEPTRRRRFDVTLVLAVLLPLLAVAALLGVDSDGSSSPSSSPARQPADTDLTSSVLICPSGAEGLQLASDTGARGTVEVQVGDAEATDAELAPRTVTEVPGGDGAAVVRAEGDVASALVGGRFSTPLGAAECGPPVFDQWFTGLGAGAKQASVLELVNPDAGPAVVETVLYGRNGVVEAPDLRGVTVPGGTVLRLDLSRIVPRRDELAAHVTTTRGRVSAAVLDSVDELGAGPSSSDYLPAQTAPSTSNLMLGLPTGEGRRTLVLANPGEDETRASVQVVTGDAVFVPEGVEDVVLPPQSVQQVPLSQVLAGAGGADAVGLLVESPTPVTATTRSFVDGDLALSTPGETITEPTATVVPAGAKQLLLGATPAADGGGDGGGAVTVTALDAEGARVDDERVEVATDRATVVDLPETAVLVRVAPRTRAGFSGSVLVTGDGAGLVRLRRLERGGLVPDVRPTLP